MLAPFQRNDDGDDEDGFNKVSHTRVGPGRNGLAGSSTLLGSVRVRCGLWAPAFGTIFRKIQI